MSIYAHLHVLGSLMMPSSSYGCAGALGTRAEREYRPESTYPILSVTLSHDLRCDNVLPRVTGHEVLRGGRLDVEILVDGPCLEMCPPIGRGADHLRA